MTVVGRLTSDADLEISGQIDERLPSVIDGLVAYFPFDGKSGTFDRVGGAQPVQNTLKGVNLIECMKMDWRDPNSWTNTSGIWDEDKQALKFVGYKNTWLKTPIVVDPSKHYQVSIDVFEEEQSSTGLYLGGLCNNAAGERVTTNYDYSYASNAQPATGVWTTYKTTRFGTGLIVSRTSQTFDNISGWTGTRVGVTDLLTKYYYYGGLFNYSSGGILYIKNLRIEIVDDDDPNLTMTHEGIAIEESTTNYLSEGLNGYEILNPVSWSGATVEIVGKEVNNELIFRYDTSGTSYIYSNDFILDDNLVELSSQTVTFSLYIRKLYGVTSGQIRIYDDISGYTYQPITVSDEFQKVSMTKTLGASPTRIFVMIDNTGGGIYEFHSPNLEKKSFATSYVTGSRGLGALQLPNSLIDFDEGSIACWFKPGAGFFSVSLWNRVFGHSSAINKNEIQVKRNSTGSNLVMSISNDTGNVQTSWSSCPSANLVANNWYHIVARWSISRGKMSLTVNGVKNEQNWEAYYQPTVKGNFDIGYHSFTTRISNSLFKELAIFDRELSDEEVLKLYGNKFSITKNGNINSFEIIEEPNGIPSDVYYYPLDFDSKDRFKIYSPSSESNTVYYDACVWVGTSASPYGNGQTGELEFNFNASIELNWAEDWSIIYWKKPISTYNNTLTGYSIESLGCNSNSVGGGYIWWGKTSGSNIIQGSTPSAIDPAKYFENWRMISLQKTGSTITIKEWSVKEGVYVRTQSTTTTVANYFVNQYGYDFKMGGWDNSNPVNAYYKDLIVAKRCLTDTEVENIFKKFINTTNENLQIKGNLVENVSF